jgi:hypothetical protein
MARVFGITGTILLLMLVVAGTSLAAQAKTINGTSRNDVLRGTRVADTINGKAGNDKLYGLIGRDKLNGGPGNDVIVGGPGADVVVCGTGNDVAFADPSDTVSADCETVHGGPTLATPGHYAGKTSQGSLIGFDVSADGKTISNLALFGDARCPDLVVHHGGTTLNGVAVDGHGAFTSAVPSDSPLAGGSISGSFEAGHGVSGTFQLDFSGAVPGTTCSTGSVSWTARPTPDLLVPGHYTGVDLTEKTSVSFDVEQDGRTVANFMTGVLPLSCQPSGTFSGSLSGTIPPFPPVTGRTLVYSGVDQTPPAGTFPFTISLNITFDAAGYFTGTTQIHMQPTQQGVRYDCDTGELDWQGGLVTNP